MINLRHRGVFLNNVNCVMCGEQGDTINHLLFTCKVATKIWNMCNKWTGNLGVSYNQIQAHFEHFHLLELNLKGNMLWKGVWIAIVWTLWNHRNNIIFRNGIPDPKEIFSLTQVRVWEWLKNKMTNINFVVKIW